MRSINPAEILKACKTMDELRQVWNDNIFAWKTRKDFEAIAAIKDSQKYRLQWPITLDNAMRRYNECCDQADVDTTVDDAISLIDEGRTLELQMAEMVKRILDEKWPIDVDGLKIMQAYVDWRQNTGQLKFNVGE